MELNEWAHQHRVRVAYGHHGAEDLVLGKFGEIAADYGDGLFRLRLLPVPRDAVRNKALNSRKMRARANGLVPLHVTAHVPESIWGFSPSGASLSELAIDLVGARRKARRRELTEAEKDVLRERLKKVRKRRAGSGPLSP